MPKPALTLEKREELFQSWVVKQTVTSVSIKCRVNHLTAKKYRKIDKWDARLADITRRIKRKNDQNTKSELIKRVQASRILQKIAMKTVVKEGIDKGKAPDIALKAIGLQHEMLKAVPDTNQNVIIVNVTGMPKGFEDV